MEFMEELSVVKPKFFNRQLSNLIIELPLGRNYKFSSHLGYEIQKVQLVVS